ncbi:unnamed protein product [Sphenostylis stenocarpa]|uniref:Uncharacterized protein n=1 Tax=Sphenostylis stenocarpa TaxID=92480 RepID=A0AA86W323_9FABA|nr:unnamed protein product [Sphenostylis stenocarpa]
MDLPGRNLAVEGGYVAALVEMGDGVVLKLVDGRLCYTNPIQNIAPILDMTVVDYRDEKHASYTPHYNGCCVPNTPHNVTRYIGSTAHDTPQQLYIG